MHQILEVWHLSILKQTNNKQYMYRGRLDIQTRTIFMMWYKTLRRTAHFSGSDFSPVRRAESMPGVCSGFVSGWAPAIYPPSAKDDLDRDNSLCVGHHQHWNMTNEYPWLSQPSWSDLQSTARPSHWTHHNIDHPTVGHNLHAFISVHYVYPYSPVAKPISTVCHNYMTVM